MHLATVSYCSSRWVLQGEKMLEFRPVTLEDKPAADRYYARSNFMGSEYCFANLFIWRKKYHTEIAEYGGFLMVKTKDLGIPHYLYPPGEGDLKEAIDELLACAEKEPEGYAIYGIKEENIEKIESLYPGKFNFSSNRASFDYIYETEALINLSGSKYHSKRNHINKFIARYGEISYRHIDASDISDCRNAYRKWLEDKPEKAKKGLEEEAGAINECMENYEALGLKGGLIIVGGEICSFTMGSPINNETFGIHVEKSLIECQGGYAVINREFAKNTISGYRYVNREEDLGLKGLRKAKMSYRPAFLLEKFAATPCNGKINR